MGETNEFADDIEDIIEFGSNTIKLEKIERLSVSPGLLKKQERLFGQELYVMLLYSMTHKSFPPALAKDLWNEIVEHKTELSQRLRRDPGVIVSALDYLTNSKNLLSNPKIIEEGISSFIADASTKDALTGLYLRDIFDIVLKKEVDISRRMKSPLALLMIDIDDFKKVNDNYGHVQGDYVLKQIGKFLNGSIREMDFAARYGGEEMAIIMPRIALDHTLIAANRICGGISRIELPGFHVTVSIGVAERTETINSPKKMILKADKALYSAKAKGKNRVEIYTPDLDD